jgi:hypothetical protein
MKRRQALKFLGLGAGASLLPADIPYVFSQYGPSRRGELNQGLLEYGIYDPNFFQAAERFMPLDDTHGLLSLLPREDKAFFARVEFSGGGAVTSPSGAGMRDIQVQGEPINIPVSFASGSEYQSELLDTVKYRVLYREGSSPWKASPWRVARTPALPIGREDMEFCFVGDPHPFDDRRGDSDPLTDPELKSMRNSGDAVNYFLVKLLRDSRYTPPNGSEEAKLMHNFCLAGAVRQLMREQSNGRLRCVIDMGDTWGGAIHAWPGLGLTPFNLASDDDLDRYTKMFAVAFRKTYSGLNPSTAVPRVLGNHDGENGWNKLRPLSLKWRKKFCPSPGEAQGHSADENYFELRWGVGTTGLSSEPLLSLLILDSTGLAPTWPSTLQGWLLGRKQRAWLGRCLSDSQAKYKIACFHHVIGGWPTESDPNNALSASYRPLYFYGRGGMFREEHYMKLLGKVPKKLLGDLSHIKQTGLTRSFLNNGGNIWFYGHDHVFKPTKIGTNSKGQEAYGISVGSTNYELYKFWVSNELFWQDPDIGYGQSGGYGPGATGRGDFLGPSGYTKLIVPKDGNGPLSVQYIRSAWHLNTNLNPASAVGDILYRLDI